jgi:hypothetical protein
MAPKPAPKDKQPGLLRRLGDGVKTGITNLRGKNNSPTDPASPTAAATEDKPGPENPKNDPPTTTSPDKSGDATKPPDQPPPTAPTPPPEESKDPVALIFGFLYTIIAIIGVIMVVVLFFMSTFDLLTVIVKTIMQHIDLMNNPNMYNIDTLDFETLLYFRNSRDTEPNTIFKQQDVLTGMFSTGYAFFFTIAFQIILFVTLLIVYKFIKGKPLTFGKFEFMKNRLAFVGIILTVATAVTALGVYKNMFLKSVQPAITTTRSNLDVIKNFIYNNLTNNEVFLTSLVNGDLTNCTAIMNQQTSLARISKMLYTMSLYNFFKINISESNEEFNTIIKKIFTVAEIRVRSINPIHYMYYNQNIFLPNIYPIIRPYIFGSNKAISTTEKDRQLRVDVTQRINETNKQLMAVYKVPVRKTELRNYIITNWFVVTVFMIVAVLVYRKPVLDLLSVGSFKELFGKWMAGKKEADEPVVGTPVPKELGQGEKEGVQPALPPPPPGKNPVPLTPGSSSQPVQTTGAPKSSPGQPPIPPAAPGAQSLSAKLIEKLKQKATEAKARIAAKAIKSTQI